MNAARHHVRIHENPRADDAAHHNHGGVEQSKPTGQSRRWIRGGLHLRSVHHETLSINDRKSADVLDRFLRRRDRATIRGVFQYRISEEGYYQKRAALNQSSLRWVLL